MQRQGAAAPGAHAAETSRTGREPPGFESQPHLRFFRTFGLVAGGFLIALGAFVSFAVDRHTTLEDVQRLPGMPSPPPTQRPGPGTLPAPADPSEEPPVLPFPTAWPTQAPPRLPGLPELPRYSGPPGG